MSLVLPRRALPGLTLAGALAGAFAGRALAAPERTLIGTYGGAGCTGVPEVAAFEAWLGRPVDLVLDFLEMSTWQGMVDEAGWMAGCWHGAHRARLAVSVPMLVGEGGPTLQQGAGGAFDAHFRALADKLIGMGYADAILRIGWEFNGGWYPWTARGAPDVFAGYWARIARTMRAAPGARFRFDWTATTVDGPTDAAYPGDDVVDIVGLDIYNQSWPVIENPARRWEYLLHHPAGLLWHRDFAAAHGKPRSFPEWGTGTRPDGHGGGDDALFVRNMLAWMRAGGPVVYQCYWNYPASDYDAKLTGGQFPQAAAALRQGLRAA